MIYEKRLLVLFGGAGGCLKAERTSGGIDCKLTGNVRGECVLAVRAGSELYAFGVFTLPPSYAFRLPSSVKMDDLVVVVGSTEGKFLMSGGFRRPLPWRGNLEDDLRRAIKMLGITEPEKKKNINDYFLDIIPEGYDDGKVAEVNYYRSNLTAATPEEPSEAPRPMPFMPPPAPPEEKKEPRRDVPPVRENTMRANEEPRTAQPTAAYTAQRPAADNVQSADSEVAGTVSELSDADYGAKRQIPELPHVTFYESVKEQVDRLFANNDRYETLEKLLPESRWVKVNYDEKGRFYLVGLIGDPVRYLCYGVPGEYSPTPPPDLVGYCQWLAIDENDPSGKGFWVMYQDGISGKSIL